MRTKKIKWCGISAIAGGVLACLTAPVMSVGYYSSYAVAAEVPPFWFYAAEPLLGALLGFADAKTSYAAYGKIFALVYLLFLPGITAVHLQRTESPSRVEKYSFIILVVALIGCFFGVSGDYWGIKQGWTLELLGLLLLQIAATCYGIGAARSKKLPFACIVLLLGSFPLCVVGFFLLKQIPTAPTVPFAVFSVAAGIFILRRHLTQKASDVKILAQPRASI